MTAENKRFLTLDEKKNVQVYEKYRIYGYANFSDTPLAEGEVCTIVRIYNREGGKDFGFDFISERGDLFTAGSWLDVTRDSFLMEPVVQ